MQLLYEKGSHALPDLERVDNLFAEFKTLAPSKYGKFTTDLEKALVKLLHCNVIVQLQQGHGDSDNFAVLPILKPAKERKQYMLTPEAIKLLHLETIYLMPGVDLLKEANPREVTGIVLHEIGHVVQHITRSAAILEHQLFKIKYISDLLSRMPIINLIFSPLFIITSRTLNFRNHVSEYGADKFAVKYGYGDELVEWCIRNGVQNKAAVPKNLMGLTYILKRFMEGTSHPSYKKRIKSMIKEMKSNYAKEYGDDRIKDILDKYYKA